MARESARLSESDEIHALPAFDWSEISQHNRKQDCWLVIDGYVYDVTDWIDQHPGGQVICSMAGEDVSTMFHSSHFSDVSATLHKYLIGTAKATETTHTVTDNFHTELKKRVALYFDAHNIDYRSTHALQMQIVLSFLIFSASWVALWFWQIWLAVLPMGLISCAMVGGFAHEYAHGSLTKLGNRNNNRARQMSCLWAIVCPFMFEKQFQYEHFQHHVSPMDEEKDYEINALAGLLRLSRNIEWRWYYQYQQFYAPFVYMYYISIQVIGGAFFYPYFAKRQLRADPEFFFQMYPATAVTLIFHVFIPLYAVGWELWMVWFLAYSAVWQLCTYLVAAVPHLVESGSTESEDWAFRSCFHTRNVLCGNKFYDWLSGGFNYQIDHHLLPSISREHLPEINHIVAATCDEFDYPYYEYTNLFDYLRDHYRYLRILGEKPV